MFGIFVIVTTKKYNFNSQQFCCEFGNAGKTGKKNNKQATCIAKSKTGINEANETLFCRKIIL